VAQDGEAVLGVDRHGLDVPVVTVVSTPSTVRVTFSSGDSDTGFSSGAGALRGAVLDRR